MDIKGFSADEAQRLVRAAHMIRPDDPRLEVGDDAAERLDALKRLVLLLEASIGSLNLGLRLFENPGEHAINKGLHTEEAISFLSKWAADPGGAGVDIKEVVDETLHKAGVSF